MRKRLSGLLLAAGIALTGAVGCAGGTSVEDQASKRVALDKVAAQSPNADKVEH